MAKPPSEWTDEEIEQARQTALAAARVERVLRESERASRVLDALFASEESPPRCAELEPPTAAPALPPVEEEQAARKPWTPERLKELRDYRAKHGTKKAAAWARVSEARVRELLPGDKPKPKGYSAFNQRPR